MVHTEVYSSNCVMSMCNMIPMFFTGRWLVTRAEGLLAMELRSMPHSRARVLETAEVRLMVWVPLFRNSRDGTKLVNPFIHGKILIPKHVGN